MKYLYVTALLFVSSQAFGRGSVRCNNAERMTATPITMGRKYISLTFWFKVTALPGATNDLIIELSDVGLAAQLGIGFRSGGSGFQATKSGGTSLLAFNPAPTSLAGSWNFVAYTNDGTTNKMWIINYSSFMYTESTVALDGGANFSDLWVCDDTFAANFTGNVADIHVASATYSEAEVMEAYRCSDFKHHKEIVHYPLWDGTTKANPTSWLNHATGPYSKITYPLDRLQRVAGTPVVDWDGPPINYCYSGGGQ